MFHSTCTFFFRTFPNLTICQNTDQCFLNVHCLFCFLLVSLDRSFPGVAGDLLRQKEEWRQHSAKCEDHTCNWTGRVSDSVPEPCTFSRASCKITYPYKLLLDNIRIGHNCIILYLFFCHSQKNQTLCVS